jgi:hypothetical protein
MVCKSDSQDRAHSACLDLGQPSVTSDRPLVYPIMLYGESTDASRRVQSLHSRCSFIANATKEFIPIMHEKGYHCLSVRGARALSKTELLFSSSSSFSSLLSSSHFLRLSQSIVHFLLTDRCRSARQLSNASNYYYYPSSGQLVSQSLNSYKDCNCL